VLKLAKKQFLQKKATFFEKKTLFFAKRLEKYG